MSDIIVPGELGDLTDEDLTELSGRITDAVTELGSELTPENVDEMERLANEHDRIQAELASRANAEAELSERGSAILSRFQSEDPEGEAVEGEGEDEVEDGASATEEEIIEAEGTERIAAAIEDGVRPGTEAKAQLSTRPRAGRLAGELTKLRQATGTSLDKPRSNGALHATFTATSKAGVAEGSQLDIGQLAVAIARRRHAMSNIPAGVHDDRIALATATMPFGDQQMLSGDMERNFGLLTNLRKETQALVASGGNCAPSAPVYDIFRLATPHSPVESNLPVVGAPRGAIRWIVPPDFADAADGIGVTLEEDDVNLGYGSGQTLKPCIRVECPDTLELYVTAVSQCVYFGNLNYRVFPEQVTAFLEDLAWQFASTKEVLYLDRIEAGSTAVTTTQTYGATRSMVRDALQAAVGYRLRNGMDIDAPLDWYVPVWAAELIKIDMVADHSMGLGFLTATTGQVQSALQDLASLNVVWTYDGSTSEPEQAMRDSQSAGALNAFPTDAVTYMHAPGTFFRIDGGTLDVGLVRDSALNLTNDLQIFSEQWIEAGKAGIEGLKITHQDVLPTGEAPVPTAGNLLTA